MRGRGGSWPPPEHDPEKRIPVFGKEHAQAKRQSVVTVRRKVVAL
jgi:hypothetical protein